MAEEVLVVVGETVNVAMAATPFAMAMLLIPVTKQMTDPAPPAQELDLPAAIAAGPSVIWTAVKSAGE